MLYTPQQGRRGTPLQGKGGAGFSFPPTGGVSGGAGSSGSIYVTPRSTPRHVDGGSVSANGGDSRRGGYVHQVRGWNGCVPDMVRWLIVLP